MNPEHNEYFSECGHCHAPRQLAKMVYGEDLVIFQMQGSAKPEDALALCRYCAESKTKGFSNLRPLEPFTICDFCRKPSWDFGSSSGYETLCNDCAYRYNGISPGPLTRKRLITAQEGLLEGLEMWKFILTQIVWMIDKNDILEAFNAIVKHYEEDGEYWDLMDQLETMPSSPGYVKRLYENAKKKRAPFNKLIEFKPPRKPN
jgi:hypothetical protein